MVRRLQAQIDDESTRLNVEEEKRQKDMAFAEQAFYTSNEEGMGVSPNTYEGQNRMPRRGKTPNREVRLTDPIQELGSVLPESRIVKNTKSVSPAPVRRSVVAPKPVLVDNDSKSQKS